MLRIERGASLHGQIPWWEPDLFEVGGRWIVHQGCITEEPWFQDVAAVAIDREQGTVVLIWLIGRLVI